MKLSRLLARRQTLLRQARLANLAFAHEALTGVARRIARARLRGEVRLQQAGADAERYWATLTALEGNQSVLDEHFLEDDVADLADLIAFATDESERDFTFRLEELASRFLAPLRAELVQAGVVIDDDESPLEESSHDDSGGCPHADEGG
jgi:hypothetical protein